MQECLPVIGSGTVSSVLPNLDGAPIDNILQNNNLDAQQHSSLIILEDSYKVTQQVRSSKTNSQKTSKKVKEQNCLEDILYFVCNSCPFLCTKDSKITEHVENAHKNQTEVKLLELKCPACPNIFYHKVSLRSHLIHDHGVGNSELSNIIQSIVYFAKKNQTKASESHKVEAKVVSVPQDGLNCKNELDAECSKESENEAGRDNNNRNATDQNCHQEIVILPTLDLTQSNAERMFTNIIKGDGIVKYSDQRSVYKCIAPLCKAAFQDVQKLNYHMASHNDTSFKCLECDEIFSFWKPLTGHLWRMHKIDMELYSCDKCDYKTYSLSKLNNIHKLIHSDVKAFACIVCQKSFKNKKQLRNHKMTHTEKSKKVVHTCEVCNKTFFDKRQMKVHMDGVHKKIKPFLCSYCGYKGASKSALKMHIRQHTGQFFGVGDLFNLLKDFNGRLNNSF